MRTLAIETSCDDTVVALVAYKDNTFIVEHLRAFSQLDIHRQYGGVVPELASRSHADKILPLLEEIKTTYDLNTVDNISVTAYPGLPGALLVGKTAAYTLGERTSKPVIEVNHIMGHVFSILCERSLDTLQLPYMCLTVSGGHNDIYLVERNTDQKTTEEKDDLGAHAEGVHHKFMHMGLGDHVFVGPYRVTKLAQTMDDAGGEVFDKLSRKMGGTFPGGKRIHDTAKAGKPNALLQGIHGAHADLPGYCFSFSGIKSQVANFVDTYTKEGKELDDELIADICYRLQEQVCHSLAKNFIAAAKEYNAVTLGICGGVSANVRLRDVIQEYRDQQLPGVPLRAPSEFVYCTDNAAMIGVAGLLMTAPLPN